MNMPLLRMVQGGKAYISTLGVSPCSLFVAIGHLVSSSGEEVSIVALFIKKRTWPFILRRRHRGLRRRWPFQVRI